MSARRCLLHREKFAAFRLWCAANGIEERPGKGAFQIIQVRVGKFWVPIYNRHQGDHYTTEGRLMPTIRKFIGCAA